MQEINNVLTEMEGSIPSPVVISAMAETFKALGDPTRLRILALLLEGERTVSQIEAQLQVSQSAVSHQMRLLRMLNIVRFRKEGREVFYNLADDHVRDILSRTLEHILYD